jgi:hypothetical protein
MGAEASWAAVTDPTALTDLTDLTVRTDRPHRIPKIRYMISVTGSTK